MSTAVPNWCDERSLTPSGFESLWACSQRCRSALRSASKTATFNPAFFAASRNSLTVSPNVRLPRLLSETFGRGSFERPCDASFLVRVFLDSLPTLVYLLFRVFRECGQATENYPKVQRLFRLPPRAPDSGPCDLARAVLVPGNSSPAYPAKPHMRSFGKYRRLITVQVAVLLESQDD